MSSIGITGQKILEITNGRICDPGHFQNIEISGISIDTRSIEKGNLFVALKGEQFDGHNYIQNALEKEASYCLSEQAIDHPQIIQVADCLQALEKIAEFKRKQVEALYIAITGSVGKTTLKEYVHSVLSHEYKCYNNIKNYNNHIGLPFCLGQIPEDTEIGIFEMGMSAKGEIRHLTKLVQPDIAIISHIGPAHIGFFESLKGITEAKSEIFEGLSEDGIVIINKESAHCEHAIALAKKQGISKILTFGYSANCDLYFANIEYKNDCTYLTARIKAEDYNIILPTQDESITQACGAILCLLSAMDKNIHSFKEVIESPPILAGRGKPVELNFQDKSLTIIDESYNANPLSMKNALKSFSIRPKKNNDQRKIVIIGDMLELGQFSDELHQELLPYLEHESFDEIFLVGDYMPKLAQQLQQSQSMTTEEILEKFSDGFLKKDDMILLKASRGIKLERIINHLHQS